MNTRITLQKIHSFQLARVQVGVIDVFWPLFDLKIMVKKIKKEGKNQNRFEETPLIHGRKPQLEIRRGDRARLLFGLYETAKLLFGLYLKKSPNSNFALVLWAIRTLLGDIQTF
jgi:hypothetical protein